MENTNTNTVDITVLYKATARTYLMMVYFEELEVYELSARMMNAYECLIDVLTVLGLEESFYDWVMVSDDIITQMSKEIKQIK